MKIWTSDDPKPSGKTDGLWVYNGLDTCVTLEVLGVIEPQLNEVTRATYERALALQAPILEMECRGIAVDKSKRAEVQAELEANLELLKTSLDEILFEGLGIYGLNYNSPAQLKTLFYETLGIAPIKKRGAITLDRKALEKLRNYFHILPLVNHILAIRDIQKKLGTVRTGVDPDGRMRTSYNIAGTDTGRLSSYQAAFGSGTNLQNITPELRKMFVASKGKKLAYIDLQQGESYAVGAILWNLFQDGRYLDACESGDLHTNVCRMCWPELPWTDNPRDNKAVAKRPFYRHFDYRDTGKRLGHGTNYFGKPPHMAQILGIPVALVTEFRSKYIAAFGLDQWHEWVRAKLLRDGWITTFMGRHRHFFGRRFDEETLRAAIAYEPQSAVAEYLNQGLMNVWRNFHSRCDLLLQVHDAIVIEYPEETENEIIPAVVEQLRIEVPLLHGRSLIIPSDAMVGWNWAYVKEGNPNGLVAFDGNDKRKRQEFSVLDRRLA